jgi:hypothetical protein
MTPAQALEQLKAGNERFLTGRMLSRDYNKELSVDEVAEHNVKHSIERIPALFISHYLQKTVQVLSGGGNH